MPPTVSLPTYRKLTLLTTIAGALLFGSGLILGISYDLWRIGGPMILVGILLGISTAFVRIEGQAASRPKGSVLFYTREDCALCDEARHVLAPLAGELQLDVWEVDVDRDPELAKRYGDVVPVAIVGEREVLRTRVDARALRETLLQAGASRRVSR